MIGRLIRPVVTSSGGVAPQIGWLTPGALFFGAAVLAYVAWSTHRTLHRDRVRLAANQAVNRLVLAKASAIAGAVVAGGYVGYALAWVGVDTTLGEQRLLRAAVSAVAGVLIVAGSVALERACRVRGDVDAN